MGQEEGGERRYTAMENLRRSPVLRQAKTDAPVEEAQDASGQPRPLLLRIASLDGAADCIVNAVLPFRFAEVDGNPPMFLAPFEIVTAIIARLF
jgi:hypothetical protein